MSEPTTTPTPPPPPSRLGWLALLPLALFALALRAFLRGDVPLEVRHAWIPSVGVEAAFRLDALALVLVLLITGIGTLVFVYAAGYMAGVKHRGRLFALLVAFMVAMLGCVTADDVILLFVFWELTSVTSFLLVGFKHEYETSRKSAQQALMITGGGGLVLLAGVLLLAHAAGTTSLQAMLASAPAWAEHPVVRGALTCVFIGAFTKSAQFPFHFWLPGAMAAPTPVSAYLHSATMVKLGVYLLARLHPAFGDDRFWQLTLVSVGGFTSVWGMLLTIRERDLKRILAWSTVSALGTLVMLIGLPGEGAATAAAAFLLAHALYKAPLFFVAGNVDLATGTRLIDELSGLGRKMPFTSAAGWIAGLSMAGIPLSFGYVAKDVIKAAKADTDLFQWVAYAGAFVSAASFAAAGIATARIFWRKRPLRPEHAREGSIATWLPPLLVASLGIVFGLFPERVESLLTEAAQAMGSAASMEELLTDDSASLSALAMIIALGVVLFLGWDRLHRVQRHFRLPRVYQAAAWYEAMMVGIPAVASRVTRRLQMGHLSTYTAFVLVFALAALGYVVAHGPALRVPPFELALGPTELAVAGATLAILCASVAVCVVRDSFVMLLVSGLVGLACALLFLFLGAPDVAFTQFTVEVAFVVVLASILLRVRRLDLVVAPKLPRWHTLSRALLSLGVGAAVAALMLVGASFEQDPSLTEYFSSRSVPDAHGRNVVNVVLVDFRAVDTLGEIIVVTLTFIAAVPLLRLLRERWRGPDAPLRRGARGMSPKAHIFDVAVRGLYPILLASSVVILLRGHNEPGGGFIAGMVAVAATSMLSVARGARAALAKMPLGPHRLAATSALLSLASGLPALFLGEPFMTHLWGTLPLGFTELDVSTVLVFDVGVYGAVWGALGGLCARAIEVDEPHRDDPSTVTGAEEVTP